MINSMMNRGKLALLTALVSLCVSTSLYAHHGTGINYDSTKAFTVQATVTKFRYAQPHLQIFLDIKDEDGNVVPWACEYAPNIPYLIREGYSKKLMSSQLAIGTEITVTMAPSRSGRPVGLVYRMTDMDGGLIGPEMSEKLVSGELKKGKGE